MSRLQKVFSFAALSAAILFSSCTDLYGPVKDYLDEYSNSAFIIGQHISVPTELDRDKIESVSSATTVSVTFSLRNPRSYTIIPALKFSDTTLPTSYGTFTQSADRESITLTFNQSFLNDHDRGTDLSGTISLTESITGRAFPSGTLSLRCNTPPPSPVGSRVMLYNDGSTTTYILCCNLDLANPVQNDLASITINNDQFEVAQVQAGETQVLTFADPHLTTTPPGPLSTIPDQQSFVPVSGSLQLYFSSGIIQSEAQQNFTITVRDHRGLSRTASTSSAGDMLAPVTVTDLADTPPSGTPLTLILNPDTNGEYPVKLTHTDNAATIHYSFEGTPGTLSGPYPQELTFTESGTLEVWATRTGYIESDHRTIHLVCRNNQYYVDPDPANGDDSNPGTRTSPFKTIEHAITLFSDSTDEENTIFLLGDVNSLNRLGSTVTVDIIPAEDITFTIDGSEVSGKATIDGNNLTRCLHINAQNVTVNLTLRNLNITKGRVDDFGAGIYFEATDNGSSLTLDGCVVEENHVVDGTFGGGVYFLGSELNIDDSQIRSNSIESSVNSRGAGIYMEGTGSSATANISSTLDTTEISGNSGEVTGAPCMGGGIYANNINLTISGGTISGNTANSENSGYGGGIYQARGRLEIQSGTTISGNWGTKASYTGYGGGIAFYGTELNITGAEISGNTASTQGPGRGGGVYVGNTSINTTTVNLSGVDINTNWASTGSSGYGGGIFAERSIGGSTNITLNGGTITGNTATNRDGWGGGIYISTTSGTVLLESPQSSNVEISGNRASTLNSSYGYGGGIHVGQGGLVEWKNGTISGNRANENGTDVTNSKGEGIYIDGASGYTTSFNFAGGTIDEGVSTVTGNVVYLNADSRFFFRGDTFIESNDPNTAGGIYLNHAASPSSPPVIEAVDYLTTSTVANLVPSTYTWSGQILTGDASINYYKFTVESDGGRDYCINADGELSEIFSVAPNDAAGLTSALNSSPTNGSTLEIKLNNIPLNTNTFTIPASAHVRIIPNLISTLDHNANGQLFIIQDGGHLLFGDPDKPITVDCDAPREQHLFDLAGAGSLVLRNITVKNAQQPSIGALTNAALVYSGATAGKSTVVLEEFNYLEDTPLPVQSTRPALQISMGSEHHFVSGSITGFNVSDSGYGGVATFYGGGTLYLYPGVVLSGNSEYMGSSITNVPPGVLHDNR